MICPFCKTDNDKVVDSRVSGTSIRRRRECLACGRRFTTREYIELQPLTVIKRNGSKEPFQREKLMKGLMDSCKKRPVSREDLENLATNVFKDWTTIARELDYCKDWVYRLHRKGLDLISPNIIRL